MRSLVALVLASAGYGFSIGLSNSRVYAVRNLVKFPLLIVATTAICALCYLVVARFLGARLGFGAVQRAVTSIFRDTAVLLCSLAPAVAFLSLTLEPQTEHDLGGFPYFLGFNVVAIAACGCLSVARCMHRGLADAVDTARQRRLLVASWMLASLLVGGQVCWLLRPFFGVATTATWESPWFSGSAPGFRGARSFYEAVLFVVAPPPGQR
ncbi:MAG TPA: hypothetical protein VFZ65_03175 [Planctomycetota bacterium]|nr:hypothetical protein [Planctomycetota bacterium]